jgi:hypothetical protein
MRRMPTWQIPTADPPYALVCWAKVAGQRGDVVVDTMLTFRRVSGRETNYRALTYARIGCDSVVRIAAQAMDDSDPPNVFLRVISHLSQIVRERGEDSCSRVLDEELGRLAPLQKARCTRSL